MLKLLSLFIFLVLSHSVVSQLPETDIWLFKLEKNNLDVIQPTKGINFTQREGYDNQPSYSKDGKNIFYISVREDKQADVYVYKIRSKKTLRLTSTTESEYSPLEMSDSKQISAVVVEKDSAQRIHFINAASGLHEQLFEFDSVGYYEFVNNDTVLYYKLTEPHSLRYYVKSSGEDRFIASSPVRAFKTINRHSFIFGIKDSVSVSIYIYDFLLRKAVLYCMYPSINEDFIWHPAYGLIKSEENKLLRYEANEKKWMVLYDLSTLGIKKITRFAFDHNNNYLIVVDNR